MKNTYLKEYRWSNIFDMLRNNKLEPKECTKTAKGLLVVITGATSGIGYETACLYASRGADLICVNRNEQKSQELKRHIEKTYKVSCQYHISDFSHLEDIRRCAAYLNGIQENIDILIHNAGVFNTHRRFTEDGLEEVFQVNYLASFIITLALREKLQNQKQARVLYVNSEGHRFAIGGIHLDDLGWDHHRYSGLKSYGSAKTAQLLSLFTFCRLFESTGVTINAMHPGDVKTNMGENNGKIYKFFKHLFINPSAKDASLSARALYYLGVDEQMEGITGKFFNFTALETPAPHALDTERSEALYTLSLKLGGIDEP